MAQCRKSPFVILCFFLYLLNLSRTAEETKELRCCAGWSDDKSSIKVVKVMAQVCIKMRHCSKDSTTDCAFRYSFDLPSPGTKMVEIGNCTTFEGSCECNKDWCNCPAAFQGEEPESGVQGLKCCKGDSNREVKEVACPNEPNQNPHPQECTLVYFLPEVGNFFRMDCDASGNRPYPDCKNYKYNPDKYSGEDGDCRCKTNMCNCRDNPAPVNSTTMKTPKTTPNSTATATPTTPLSTTAGTMTNLGAFLGLFILPILSSSYQKHPQI